VSAALLIALVSACGGGGEEASLDEARVCRSVSRLLDRLAGGEDAAASRELRRLRAIPGVNAELRASFEDPMRSALDVETADRADALDVLASAADDGELTCALDVPAATAVPTTPPPTPPTTEPVPATTEPVPETTGAPVLTTVPDDEVIRPVAITGTPIPVDVGAGPAPADAEAVIDGFAEQVATEFAFEGVPVPAGPNVVTALGYNASPYGRATGEGDRFVVVEADVATALAPDEVAAALQAALVPAEAYTFATTSTVEGTTATVGFRADHIEPGPNTSTFVVEVALDSDRPAVVSISILQEQAIDLAEFDGLAMPQPMIDELGEPLAVASSMGWNVLEHWYWLNMRDRFDPTLEDRYTETGFEAPLSGDLEPHVDLVESVVGFEESFRDGEDVYIDVSRTAYWNVYVFPSGLFGRYARFLE